LTDQSDFHLPKMSHDEMVTSIGYEKEKKKKKKREKERGRERKKEP